MKLEDTMTAKNNCINRIKHQILANTNHNKSTQRRACLLEINLNESTKTVEIWLTREERQDEQVKNSLKPIFASYKSQKYIVAVYESGESNLLDTTKDLLMYNRGIMV